MAIPLNGDREKLQRETQGSGSRRHYYGDVVRKLFMGGGVAMLATLPFFTEFLVPLPLFVSLLTILVFGFAAGITNPLQRWTAVLNVFIAGSAAVTFEFYAVDAYADYSGASPFFWVNQLLALNFFVALYYGSKTLRGMYLKG